MKRKGIENVKIEKAIVCRKICDPSNLVFDTGANNGDEMDLSETRLLQSARWYDIQASI